MPPPPPDPIFLGYRFKRIARRPPGWCLNPDGTPAAPAVRRICSVSNCISPEPETKFLAWAFNNAGCYDRPDPALASIPPEQARHFTPMALECFPLLFHRGVHTLLDPLTVFGPALPVEPAPPGLTPLGLDVVVLVPSTPRSRTSPGALARFECSPLSCNGEAAHHPVNSNCLLDGWEDAVAAAVRFSRDEPEPGSYVILRVLAPS
jgi:hypothetical protein